MQSLVIVVVHDLFKAFSSARPTSHPRIIEAIDTHFEGVKPLSDEGSISIVDPTFQSDSGEGGPVAKLIDEKHSLGEIVFLAEFLQKWSRRITVLLTM